MVTVGCACGVVFYRWITPEDAARDMVWSTILAMPS